MKTLLMTLITASSLNAVASAELTDEIICHSVHQPGSADQGMTVLVKSNTTAWKKQAVIFENGYAGTKQIASFQIPLQPEETFDPKFGSMEVYENEDFELKLAVFTSRSGLKTLGAGHIEVLLPGYGIVSKALKCRILVSSGT